MAKMTFVEYKEKANVATENIEHAKRALVEIHMGKADPSMKDFYVNSIESNTFILKSLKEAYEAGLAE